MRLLLLTRYGPMGASSRMRTFQYLPSMIEAGWRVEVSSLFSDEQLAGKYQTGQYGTPSVVRAYVRRIRRLMDRKHFDLVWIEKEALPWVPAVVESWLLRGVPYVLDIDDALFHNYDLHSSSLVRWLLGRRIDRLMAKSSLVVAGNRYLAERATRAGARRVEILPTVVDLDRYGIRGVDVPGPPKIVWIGSPSTVRYLRIVAKPLADLATRLSFRLRIIGGGAVSIPGVDVEVVPWSTDTEAANLAACDVGIMPLEDTPWEQGKCAYKLIQYMACGLPGVASPVGANCEIVIDGENGYFAQTSDEWIEKLELLLTNPVLRQNLGRIGMASVQSKYCLEVAGPQLIEMLSEVTVRGTRHVVSFGSDQSKNSGRES